VKQNSRLQPFDRCTVGGSKTLGEGFFSSDSLDPFFERLDRQTDGIVFDAGTFLKPEFLPRSVE